MNIFFKKRVLSLSFILISAFLALLISVTNHAKTSQKPPPPQPPMVLEIVEQNLTIDGKTAKVFNLVQPDGTFGLVATKGQAVDVIIKNKTPEQTAINWHGLILPNNLDGVPFITQKPIKPGEEFRYKFPLIQSGTFWLSSHYKLQQQQLMAAPFIVRDVESPKDIQEVVMFLQDFTFGNPKEVYTQRRQQLMEKLANVQMSEKNVGAVTTAPEITMDTYLTNHRTLADPDVFLVQPGGLVRLRIINAGENTNFIVDLGSLTGRILTADSEAVEPVEGSKFQLGQGQRLDIGIQMPPGDNAYPILAQAEGTSKQTGLILSTPNAIVPKFSETANTRAGDLDYSQELNLRGQYPLLPQGVNRNYTINISGNMLSYLWTMNGEGWPNVTPLKVNEGERIEVTLNNKSGVPISINLHGHVFQIVQINNQKLKGAMRDTVLVLPFSSVKIQFDAENPGIWLLQGNVPFLPYGGMGTLISYEGYTMPIFNQKDTGVPPRQ